jgi:hypothetical protein
MTTFKEIRGTTVESVSSDPTNPEVGQIWYNNTIGVLKGYKYVLGTWASGGNMTDAFFGRGVSGTQTASLVFGGRNPGPVFVSGNMESYNGSSWSPAPSLNTARRYLNGFGTQTASIACAGAPGGNVPGTITESYNGSSWTSVNSLGTGDNNGGFSLGTQTAGLFAGVSSPNTASEEWDGTNWTAGGTLNTGRDSGAGAGTQTAGLIIGGSTLTAVEAYNGSTWTTVASLNTARNNDGGGGTQTAAYCFGASPPTNVATEQYDGTSWVTQTNLSTARSNPNRGSVGTVTAGLAAGGDQSPFPSVTTEEFTGGSIGTQKITTS